MNKYKKKRKQERKEKNRLKALPKPLRKLETELDFFVEFFEEYDGYLDDFTGNSYPVKLIDNPFSVLNEMNLNLPDENACPMSDLDLYIDHISEALQRMLFYVNFETPTELKDKYRMLRLLIESPPAKKFGEIFRYEDGNLFVLIERFSPDYFDNF